MNPLASILAVFFGSLISAAIVVSLMLVGLISGFENWDINSGSADDRLASIISVAGIIWATMMLFGVVVGVPAHFMAHKLSYGRKWAEAAILLGVGGALGGYLVPDLIWSSRAALTLPRFIEGSLFGFATAGSGYAIYRLMIDDRDLRA